MHLKGKGIVRLLLFPLFLFVLYSCNTQHTTHPDTRYVDSVARVVMSMSDSATGQYKIGFLDSTIGDRQLSPDDRFRILSVKQYMYQNKILNYKMALIYADSMLWMTNNYELKDIGEKKFSAHKQIADASYRQEHYKAAYENYEIARSIADTVSSPYVKSKYLFSLAMAYFKEEKYLQSARYFGHAYEVAEYAHLSDSGYIEYYKQEVLANAGLAYSRSEMFDSSMYFYRLAFAYIEEHKGKFPDRLDKWNEAASVVYGNMASLYKQRELIDSAEHYFKRSIDINKISGRNIQDRRYNQLKLADLYLNRNQLAEASALLREVDASIAVNSVMSPDDSLELAYRRSIVYTKYYDFTHDYEKAFTYLRQHHSAEEAKAERVQKRQANSLEAGIGNASYEKQILLLEKDNKIRSQKMTILVLVVLVSICAILIIYYFMRLHKINSEQLKIKNAQIISESAQIRNELQQKIEKDKANYLALLENTDDCLWSMDKDLNLLAFNKVYKEFIYFVSGRFPEVGKPDILREVDAGFYKDVYAGYQLALSGTTFKSIDKGIKTNGNNHDFAMRFNPVKDKNGDILGITCSRKDLTEYFNLINSLKKNTEQFRNIAWIQSHALRGPLTTIMGIVDVLSDEEGNIDMSTNKELIKGLKEKLAEMDKHVNEIVKLTY